MRRIVTCLVAGSLVMWASTVSADPQSLPTGYSISWDFTYDFDSGLQGWTISGDYGGSPIGEWVDPSTAPNGPMLPDGFVSGTSGLLGFADTSASNNGGYGLTGGGSLWLPGIDASGGNEAIARIAVADLIGANTATAFQMMCDVYIPNLWQLKSDPGLANAWENRPGMDIGQAGMGAERDDNDAIIFEGWRSSGESRAIMKYRDYTGSNSSSYLYVGGNHVHCLEQLWENMGQPTGACQFPLNETSWWDKWVTLFMDYNYSVPGKVDVWIYIPYEHPWPNCGFVATNGPGWLQWWNEDIPDAAHLPTPWHEFYIGGAYSWTTSQWDNVKLKLPAGCNDPFADIDGDGDVDQTDFGIWQYCFTGVDDPNGAYDAINCGCFDRDGDSDVDETDRADFMTCASLSGPAIPADPSCD